MNLSARSLIDLPVTALSEEALGLTMHAEALADFVSICETPLTIGIQGDWGIGKTSLLNLLTTQLAPVQGRKKRFHSIYINTWQYCQFNREDKLSISILEGIITSMEKIDTLIEARKKPAYKEATDQLLSFVSNISNQLVKQKFDVDVKEGMRVAQGEMNRLDRDMAIMTMLSEMKDRFSNLVNILLDNGGDKLIIIIDDLDRIRPIRALEVLEAIKNFLDVPGCVFIIAVDYNVIYRGMEEKLGSSAKELQGKSYFDKIIQVPFNMPVNSYKIDHYIMSLIGWDYSPDQKCYIPKKGEFFCRTSDRSLSNDEGEFFENITRLTIGKNPRSIKRVINYAMLLKLVVGKKRERTRRRWTLRDAKLLYSLTCLQLAYPELFEDFIDDPSPEMLNQLEDFDYLSNLPGMRTVLNRSGRAESIQSNITGFFDEVTSLLDRDGNGYIDMEEFNELLSMLNDTNLANNDVEDLDKAWDNFVERIYENSKGTWTDDQVKAVIDLFRSNNSMWNNRLRCRIINAGKRFCNILWNKKQIGSLVTTKAEPLRLYLKCNVESLRIESPHIIDVLGQSHYGIGDTKIDVTQISSLHNGQEEMNRILDAYLKI